MNVFLGTPSFCEWEIYRRRWRCCTLGSKWRTEETTLNLSWILSREMFMSACKIFPKSELRFFLLLTLICLSYLPRCNVIYLLVIMIVNFWVYVFSCKISTSIKIIPLLYIWSIRLHYLYFCEYHVIYLCTCMCAGM